MSTERLAVLRPDGNLIGILSQMDIMKWIKVFQNECDSLTDLLSKTIKELSLCKEVITISDTAIAKEAFYTIRVYVVLELLQKLES